MASNLDPLFNKEFVEACRLVADDELRFIAEKDIWGFFPNVLFAAADIGDVTMSLQNAARILSSPLQCDESAFSSFPLRLPQE